MLSVRHQCELPGLNRSQLYRTPTEPSEAAARLKEEIMAGIDFWHTELPAIGSRKIVAKLREEGYSVGRKLVRRYMGEMDVHAIYPKPNLSKRDFRQAVVPYLLKNINVWLPNQVWSIDITYIRMHRRHMYLTAIIDRFSRKIVDWDLSDTPETENVTKTVRDAVDRFGCPGILNSDQGSWFTSNEYKKLLKSLHIRQSMDGKSRWADNIMIERWFRSLKTEEIYINEYHTPRDLRISVREYIRKYNEERPHEALDNAVPDAVYAASFVA